MNLFDSLPRLEPEREVQLSQFIDQPVDSRDPVQVSQLPSPLKHNPMMRLPIFQVDEADRLWEEKFSRMPLNIPPQVPPWLGERPTHPSIIARQFAERGDPLHRMSVEEISVLRSSKVQGPLQRLGDRPAWRCLPKCLASQHLVHGRIIP
jgi:hypothetical protein